MVRTNLPPKLQVASWVGRGAVGHHGALTAPPSEALTHTADPDMATGRWASLSMLGQKELQSHLHTERPLDLTHALRIWFFLHLNSRNQCLLIFGM